MEVLDGREFVDDHGLQRVQGLPAEDDEALSMAMSMMMGVGEIGLGVGVVGEWEEEGAVVDDRCGLDWGSGGGWRESGEARADDAP